MTLLKFSDVSLAFGAMPLLDKVSWQIARGERVCIIGRNGTGKTTTIARLAHWLQGQGRSVVLAATAWNSSADCFCLARAK